NFKFCNVRNIHKLHISQMSYNDIYIYKPIGPRTEDDCEVVTAEDVMRQLDWSEDCEEVVVHVNSPGGSYHEGIAIFNALNACQKHLTVKIEGMAASIASIIILAADEIVMSPFARIMTHRVKGVSKGNAAQMRTDAAEIETFEATLLEIYSRRTGLTPEECRTKFLADTDTWFTAEEAVAAKMADRIEEGKLQIGIKTMISTSMQDAAAFYQSCAAILTVPNSTKDMDFLKIKNQLHLEADVSEEGGQKPPRLIRSPRNSKATKLQTHWPKRTGLTESSKRLCLKNGSPR
ncbi:MAG: Clp protease ClpP, partial [Methylobacter sp.]|nr:Clp protease ClpP [Methylobacter sp.]